MHNRGLVLAAVLVIGIILAGEAYIYTFNTNDIYHIETSMTDGSVSYSIYSGISTHYDVVVVDNSDFVKTNRYYIYYDESYKSNLNDVFQPIGSEKLDQWYYVSQLSRQLSNRGIDTIMVDAKGLEDRLQNDIDAGKCNNGLIVASGALPDTVYRGLGSDLIFDWITAGGRLYWVGNAIGSCYSTVNEIVDVEGDYQSLFFGVSDCLNLNGPEKAYSDDTSNDFRYSLSLSSNDLRYAPNRTLLPGSMTAGYTEGEFSSVTFVGYGQGMICIVAGDYSNNQRADLAQLIGAHICHKSEINLHESGDVTRGSVDNRIDIAAPSGNEAIYTYLGGYYLVYAKGDCYYDHVRS